MAACLPARPAIGGSRSGAPWRLPVGGGYGPWRLPPDPRFFRPGLDPLPTTARSPTSPRRPTTGRQPSMYTTSSSTRWSGPSARRRTPWSRSR
ncbi:hypothetical protein KPATCC21470_1030 [Kitasatospora purpeofusca]